MQLNQAKPDDVKSSNGMFPHKLKEFSFIKTTLIITKAYGVYCYATFHRKIGEASLKNSSLNNFTMDCLSHILVIFHIQWQQNNFIPTCSEPSTSSEQDSRS